jgi:glycosyltransferase involved in cell wall biosynthesis
MSSNIGRPTLSVIMPCFNRAHGIARVLRAYDRQTGDVPFELIAVDDGSTDDTHRILAEFRPTRFTLRVGAMPANGGPAAARNRGMELARGDLIAFVGDDICPAVDFVAGHAQAHRDEPQEFIAVLGKTVWPIDMPRTTLMTHIDGVGAQQFSYHWLRDGELYDFRHLYTSNVSLKRAFLEKHRARFDTIFPYAAFEDAELAYRLERHGLRIRYRAHILATHYHYYTARTFAERQFKCGQMSLIFLRKHPAVLTKLMPSACLKLIAKSVLRSGRPAPESAAALEARALSLASTYEADGCPGLDTLYLALLQYYYCKGQAAALLGARRAAPRILDHLAALALAQPIADFLRRTPL